MLGPGDYAELRVQRDVSGDLIAADVGIGVSGTGAEIEGFGVQIDSSILSRKSCYYFGSKRVAMRDGGIRLSYAQLSSLAEPNCQHRLTNWGVHP